MQLRDAGVKLNMDRFVCKSGVDSLLTLLENTQRKQFAKRFPGHLSFGYLYSFNQIEVQNRSKPRPV
jgi:hypothetical protein